MRRSISCRTGIASMSILHRISNVRAMPICAAWHAPNPHERKPVWTPPRCGVLADPRTTTNDKERQMAKYQGHKNWNHWNVALWIASDEPMYRLALRLKRE